MTRRELLAAGGVLLQETGGRKLRVGIVGGGFGTSFQFHEHPACEVAAVADLRAERRERLAKTYRCGTIYNSLDELLKDRSVEAVGLFTPAPEHVRHASQVVAAGKHVLSAVPAAMSLAECERLIESVRRSGRTYMMAETSYYQQLTISAREFYAQGRFGEIYFCESEYHHPGLEELYFENGQRTWRHGFPPMHYPTHCTAHLLSVTGERLTEVSCHGWGDGDAILKDNVYRNPFWNETAMFRTDKGHAFRVAVWWRGAHLGAERAQWYGDKMSFFMEHPNGLPPRRIHSLKKEDRDDAGFTRWASKLEPYEEVKWWATDRLPAPLRHNSGHQGSHTFLTHEFSEAVLRGRRPTVDVFEAVSYTAPGIVAHQSALKGGALLRIPAFAPPAGRG